MKLVYTAAAHRHWSVTPGVFEKNWALQVTGLMPPGRVVVTGSASPVRNVLPLRPNEGTVVSHVSVAVLKDVVAVVACGSKVMSASGTSTLNGVVLAMNWIVAFRSEIVTGVAPRRAGLRTLLNHRNVPALIGVPLKLLTIDTGGQTAAGLQFGYGRSDTVAIASDHENVATWQHGNLAAAMISVKGSVKRPCAGVGIVDFA